MGFVPKKFSHMILLKWLMLHILQGKSWRQIGRELNVPHVSVYHFFQFVWEKKELEYIFAYFIERRITLYLGDEKNITLEYLERDDLVEKSLIELARIFGKK